MKFTELLKCVEHADTAEEIVGPDDEGRAKRVKRARAELHPDRHTGTDKIQAEHAFARLEELLGKEKRHIDAVEHASLDITTRKRTYLVDGLAFKGKIANLYNVRYLRDDQEKRGLLKVARAPRDNDLINAEASALNLVWKARDDNDEPDKRIPFYPRPEELFTYRDPTTHIDRRAIVQRRLTGFVSLDEVSQYFKDGLDVRDIAWIWRRVLGGISLAHDLGRVHGSLTPAHILIHPEVHGVQIVGWGQSVEIDQPIKLLGDRRNFYPPEVLNKEPASTATDIYTLTKTMWSLVNHRSPGYGRFAAFVRGCTFDRSKTRPQSALALLEEYDELLGRLFGPRTFRQFPAFSGRATSPVVN